MTGGDVGRLAHIDLLCFRPKWAGQALDGALSRNALARRVAVRR